MEFLIISLIFIILLLSMIWRPFFSQKKSPVEVEGKLRDETNVRLYHEHKAEIEKDYQEAKIDEENYQYLLAELDNTLLQDIENTESTVSKNSANNKTYSPFWPLGLSLFVVFFSFLVYQQQGNFWSIIESSVTQGSSGTQQSANSQKQNQALAYVNKLKQQIEANPNDSEAWYNLGQTYVAIGGFTEAIAAFKQVVAIEGEHADLFGAIAQALYYQNQQKITVEVQEYIDRALALDVNDASTNILLGMHNFIAENFQGAISYWQIVINANNPGVNINALKEAVTEARYRLNENASAGLKQPNIKSNGNTTNAGPQLKISVSLSDEVVAQLANQDDRVVFVYAVPTNGQRMPLAAVKMKASDLPSVIVLNNSQAMSPANTLSSVKNAHVYAIVSKEGGVGIKSGDYKAEALNIEVNRSDTLELVVDKLVE
jgi:cytochrome c-type biogenesis protein CcmH